MSAAVLFKEFRANLSIRNTADISTKYRNITARLNFDFWDSDSDTQHSLQIGSYGRHTAITGISDLDMVFELPPDDYQRYKGHTGNGPSAMLQDVRTSLLNRYPKSDVRADGQVVGVSFAGYRVEVLPAFVNSDGDYIHGDTNDGGAWKTTKPRPEIAAVNKLDGQTNGNLKDVCKMLRAWKNQTGVGIGGLLIDTLVYNYFSEHSVFHAATYADYPELLESVFSYLGGQPEQDYWLAPGSNQRVRCKARFQAKARKAAARCQEALGTDDESQQAKLWRKVFGKPFPKYEAIKKAAVVEPLDKEEFVEDRYPVDIRYNIELDCEILESGISREMLRRLLRRKQRLPVGRRLRFHVTECNIPGDYSVLWKVRNQGREAVKRKMLRGEISAATGNPNERYETTDFPGDHFVEVYGIKDGVCVARERIKVPI